jgi:hypothetical protein
MGESMRGNRMILAVLVMVLGTLGLTGCGGGYQPSSGSSSGGGTTASGVASLTLLASSSQLPSAANTADQGVTITAIAKDSKNGLVSNALVSFTANHGALAFSSGTTDSSGTVTNTLTAAGDQANQLITVSASSGGVSATVTVQESGTSVSISGSQVVGSGDTDTYVVKVVDSAGLGIQGKTVAVTSTLNNPVSFISTAVTDANGEVQFSYTGTTGGSDTLKVSVASLSATGSYPISVSSSKLVFQAPMDGAQINFGSAQPVQVLYTQNGTPVSGATVDFSATRGTLGAASAVTDGSGIATTSIQSSGAGGAGSAIVTAQVAGGGPLAKETISFLATTPASIDIQASPSTITPSGSSTITATVRDANNNLVQGKVVTFTLTDISGGSLSAGSATTDQLGNATVTYNASSNSSSNNGVVINAAVQGTSVTTTTPAYITVGGSALHITLGTGNKIAALDETRYELPYSVFVADAAGNPAPSNTTFRLSIRSTSYQKGYLAWDGKKWAPQYAISSSDAYWDGASTPSPFIGNDVPPFGCVSEDAYGDGILTPALDYNANNVMDPGSVAVVPSSVALSSGSAQFYITYPKDHAYWVEVQLTATATVSGNSTTATATFVLPGLADDYNTENIAPPGELSPYGQAAACTDKG